MSALRYEATECLPFRGKSKKRIRELERVLGKKTLENEILTEAVKLAHEKKLISRMPLLPQDDSL